MSIKLCTEGKKQHKNGSGVTGLLAYALEFVRPVEKKQKKHVGLSGCHLYHIASMGAGVSFEHSRALLSISACRPRERLDELKA